MHCSHRIAGFVIATGALACAASPSRSPASTPSSEAVGAMLDDWHAAAARADEAAYFSHFTKNGVFLGTDATERWGVAAFRAYAHPHFAKGKAWSFHATHRTIAWSTSGDVAWFDEELATERLGPARGSGVVVREGGELRIAQYNLSITIPNERFADVRRVLQSDAGPD
jgi:ketosteroid isomerase-like protein